MSEPMTEERLAEIEAQANAATAGPWEANDYGPSVRAANGATIASGGDDPCDATVADCVFIATAREAMPDLVDELRRRGDRIAELTEALRSLDAALPGMPPNGHGIPTPCPVCCLPRCTPECARAAARRVLARKDGGE